MRSFKLFLSFILIFSFITYSNSNIEGNGKISLEEFYKVRSYFGKSARNIKFSYDDNFLTFLWNPYDEFGYDLYIYDISEKKLKRVTSIDIMKKYDTPKDHEKFLKKGAQKREEENMLLKMYYSQRDYLLGKETDLSMFEKNEIEKLKKELKKEEQEKEKKRSGDKVKKGKDKVKKGKDKKKKTIDEMELWELRDKLKKRKKDNKIGRKDLYPGVSRYFWANKGAELIFEYRGDLYRYFPGQGKTERLSKTDASERLVSYTSSDDGYYYLKKNEIFLVKFNSSYIHQLNHRIEKEKPNEKKSFKIKNTTMSPDGKWMLITASKKEKKGGYKDVIVANYEERFVKAEKIKRQMTDTKRNEPVYRLFLRKVNDLNFGKQPEHIFETPGGDIWYEMSNVLWSKDSKYYAFMTWEREKGDLKIWLGKAGSGKKPAELFKMKETIGYKSSYWDNLKFTPDSKKLVAILNNKEGFRQPYIFDLKTGKKRAVIKGKFESFPVFGFSKDSKNLYTVSSKQDPAYLGVYRVGIKSGKMDLIGKLNGVHSSNAVSHNGGLLASVFGNWKNPNELNIKDLNNNETKILTKSHNPDWEKLNFIKPELFKYKNRHGNIIHGMMFKPEGWKPEDTRAAIVYLYGGPLGRSHTIMTSRISTLSYMFQMVMAAKHGFVTVNIDPRGQSGYGRKFNEANFKNPGESQTEDLEDLVKEMKKGGFGVDTSRIGLHGWSFGGYQTLYTMFRSPDTFACGISAAPPTQWENYNSWYTGATIGDSKRGKMNIRKYSLLPMAKNLKNPLLLVHGMMDKNVLYQDTVNLYRALLKAGKETIVDLFLDPDGGHGLGGSVKTKGTFKKFESWFLKNLKKK